MFQAHLQFERDEIKQQEREEERNRQAAPLASGQTAGTWGKPPPIEVLKTLPGWKGGDG